MDNALSTITRKDFCSGLLSCLSCMLGADVLNCADANKSVNDNELLYFLSKLPTIRNASICFMGDFSGEVLLACLDELVASCDCGERKYWLASNAAEASKIVSTLSLQKENCISLLSRDDFNELKFTNLISVLYEPSESLVVCSEDIKMVLESSLISILVMDSQRVVECDFLPSESSGWHGDIMTVGARAIVVINKGDCCYEV